jgi:hypothetical protein
MIKFLTTHTNIDTEPEEPNSDSYIQEWAARIHTTYSHAPFLNVNFFWGGVLPGSSTPTPGPLHSLFFEDDVKFTNDNTQVTQS